VNFNSAWHSSGLTSFNTPLQEGRYFFATFYNNTSLTDFSADVFSNWNPSSIAGGVFHLTWTNCTSLTAQSVENILTSIDASGKYATSTGAAGGTALADAGIDIDYNGDPLSAATTAAIDSLSGKGWQVYINGELVIPNILDLAPAAAYSLRSFDADADPNVVNVRRSSDGATSDFTASEVSDGTLTDWVNTDVDRVTPTAANGGFESGTSQWTLTSASIDTNVFYDGTQSARLDIVSGGYAQVSRGILGIGLDYRVGFWAKTSDITKQIRVEAGTWTSVISFTTTDWEYKQVDIDAATSITLRIARQTSTGDYTINIDNVTLTQLTADGHVTTWYDQSDNGNDSTQSTASAQPKIVDGGTLVTDSANNPAIIGDGVDDTLVHPTLTDELDSSDFLVTAAYKDDLTMGIVGAIPRLYLRSSSMSYNTLNTVGYPNQTGRNVMSFQVTGNTQEVFGNGASLGTASETQVDIGQNMFNVMQGGSNFSDGPLMEVVVFGDNQSTNRTGIENNINDHYSIY
jgi:hypothetical protein